MVRLKDLLLEKKLRVFDFDDTLVKSNSKVYVKNPKGNVVKVNFGQGGDAKGGTMRIRKSNPAARKSFRARHNCDNPGPRHKARYWSCKKW